MIIRTKTAKSEIRFTPAILHKLDGPRLKRRNGTKRPTKGVQHRCIISNVQHLRSAWDPRGVSRRFCDWPKGRDSQTQWMDISDGTFHRITAMLTFIHLVRFHP